VQTLIITKLTEVLAGSVLTGTEGRWHKIERSERGPGAVDGRVPLIKKQGWV